MKGMVVNMKSLRNNKGSITLFVLIAMMFFVIFAISIYLSSTNSESISQEATKRTKEIYEEDVNNVNEIYNQLTNNAT